MSSPGRGTMPDPGKTGRRRALQFRDRWSSFDRTSGLLELSERLSPEQLRGYELFASYDDKFLERISSDVSVALWRRGAVLFEEGAYIDLAFFVVEGSVIVSTETLAGHAPIFDADRTAVGESMVVPPALGSRPSAARPPRAQRPDAVSASITMLASMDFDLDKGRLAELGPGEVFGEIGAMSGWPQSVTARCAEDTLLVQIRLPALRAMKRKSSALKDRLDAVYRERTLSTQLRQTPRLNECPPLFVEALAEAVELVSLEPGEVLVQQGDQVEALYLLRSGFLRLSERYGSGEIVSTYLSKGMTLGELELLLRPGAGWTSSATSVEYSEVVVVPLVALERVVASYPAVEEQLWQSAAERHKEAAVSRADLAHAEFVEIALDSGLVQGNSILAIDLGRCTRCDDCVRDCAATHGGRARFVREGDKVDNVLIARSCLHCQDPVCLVGCPTGAIHRAGVGDVVAIAEEICIGCGTCARNCPYDAIVMHDTGETWPLDMVPESLRSQRREVASKCDLCFDRGHDPACVSNCPQGCAFRVESLEEFEALLRNRPADREDGS